MTTDATKRRTTSTSPSPRRPHALPCTRSFATSALPALVASLALATGAASADIVAYDESAMGDASDDRFAPTMAGLAAGSNLVRGNFGASPTPEVHDLDYITITVPANHELRSFLVVDADVGGAFSFVAIQAGAIVTIPPDWTSVESPLLGWAHFGTSSIGSDIFGELGSAPGAAGFSTALPAGTYALWIMELDSSAAYSYSFSLGVVEIPAPGAAWLLALGLAPLGRRRRR